MKYYGTGNELRMTGEHETSRYDQFSSGRANRGASVRIGNETILDECIQNKTGEYCKLDYLGDI